MRANKAQKQIPISKEKVKAVLDIMAVAHAFSGQINTRPKQPLILCPFHDDKNLGSCRVYTDTNTFYCESCKASGDALKLASGYMGIPLNQMNELLEEVVSRFGISRESVTAESTKKPTINKKSLLSVEAYQFLNFGKEYFEIPIEFDTFEFENDEIEYWPVKYQKIYFRSLAMRDPKEHDWVICAITRTPWFKDKMYVAQCIMEGRRDDCWFTEWLIKTREELLYEAVLDKRAYREEMAIRKRDLKEMLVDAELWPSREELLKGA